MYPIDEDDLKSLDGLSSRATDSGVESNAGGSYEDEEAYINQLELADSPLSHADRLRLSEWLGVDSQLLLYNGGEAHQTGDGCLFMLAALQRFVATRPVTPFPAECLPSHPSAVGRKLLVLDLDNTLIFTKGHSIAEDVDGPCSDEQHPPEESGRELELSRLYVDEESGEQSSTPVFVTARPGCYAFLREMATSYDVCVFTASERAAAAEKVAWLEHEASRGKGPFAFRFCLYREHCMHANHGPYCKDLRMLVVPEALDADDDRPSRSLADIILVDDSSFVVATCVSNLLPIRRWSGELDDRVLPNLVPFLAQLAGARDVRPLLRLAFQVEAKAEALFEQEYASPAPGASPAPSTRAPRPRLARAFFYRTSAASPHLLAHPCVRGRVRAPLMWHACESRPCTAPTVLLHNSTFPVRPTTF